MNDRATVPCGLCSRPTPMLGTRRCDGCWELEKRVQAQPDIARRVLATMQADPMLLAALQELAVAIRFAANGIRFQDGEAEAAEQALGQLRALVMGGAAPAAKGGA